jgi:hypothetical protein
MTSLASSRRPATLAMLMALWAGLALPAQAGERLLATASTTASAAASMPRHRTDTPLRFDPPAAGPAHPRADYEACIDHPSPDGLACDCSALLPRAPKHRK